MQMPAFDLPTVDGGRVTDADLHGRPWFAYLSRHTGCFVCQHHLRSALELRPQLQALGGDMVVFFPARVDHVREWYPTAGLPDDLLVGIDADCELYEALGTRHGTLLHNLHKQAKHLWDARGQLRRWRLTADDMTRMGADLAVAPDGELVFKHLCQDPGDRADPRTVLDALSSVAVA